jgi:diketogulonate reductase-like aldo/keto reductase
MSCVDGCPGASPIARVGPGVRIPQPPCVGAPVWWPRFSTSWPRAAALSLRAGDADGKRCPTSLGSRAIRDEGLFEEFGVSNFSAWQVAEASELAARPGWVRPTVYQGLYNAVTRAVDPELFKCIGNYGIRFHACNPLAGGAFARSFGTGSAVAAGSRFDISHAQGKLYRDRYWNDGYLDALAEIQRSCATHGLDAISVAVRWLIHHSQLNAERNDGVIIGASSLEQLRHNLAAVTEGPLPTDVLTAIDDAVLKARNGRPISPACRFRFPRWVRAGSLSLGKPGPQFVRRPNHHQTFHKSRLA